MESAVNAEVPPARCARLFYPVVAALTILAVAPLWLTHLLPMQDYPQILVFARAYGDCHDPASPFFGTYTTGFPLSPLLLPLLLLRALGAPFGLETAGRLVWTLYAVGLPAASIHLLDVLGRDRWAVVLVYPLVLSYWAIGGFFAFATAAPLFVLGLAIAVRWLTAPTWRRGAALAGVFCALHLWHALMFAQLLFDLGVLWLLVRGGDPRARLRALAPAAPAVLLFVAWMRATIVGHAPGAKPPTWPPFVANAKSFLDFIVPDVPVAAAALRIVALLVLIAALAGFHRPSSQRPDARPFRVESPFALLALLGAACFLVFPGECFGVQGIGNRQPWIAALLLVFGIRMPSRPTHRAAFVVVAGGAAAVMLADLGRRFVAFDRETVGASRLIDRLAPGDTLLAPLRGGTSAWIPARPLAALELYASIRGGGLPSSSFAGYETNLVRYAGKNPMPGLIVDWLGSRDLARYDYVLLRGPKDPSAARPELVRRVASDGEWSLYAVCASRVPCCGTSP